MTPCPKPPKPEPDPAYLAEVRQLPCALCRRHPCDPHHPIEGRHSQSRVSDRDAYPLCADCHRFRHASPAKFLASWGPESELTRRTQEAVKKIRRELIGGRSR